VSNFAVLDPVALLKTIRGVEQELLALSNHEINAAAPAQPEYFDAFATAWHSDYRARPGSGEDDHQALVENPRRSVRGELAVGGRLADGGTQSHRQGTADAAEPALSRPLP
jgi:hypothetical protein